MNRPMRAETNEAAPLRQAPGDGWWFCRWAGGRVAAGMTDRHTDVHALLDGLDGAVTTVSAEQVHGASVAVIERPGLGTQPVPGCDALLTHVPGVALLVRTADCLPIVFVDPQRAVVGIAHAGWRGLAASLPARVVSAFRHAYHSEPRELQVAIGPAIRACCYAVGPEFAARFGPFVREQGGRRTCDLVGMARAQLLQCGVRPERVLDSRRCTACETQHWFSLRRDGPSTGRLTSLVVMRP